MKLIFHIRNLAFLLVFLVSSTDCKEPRKAREIRVQDYLNAASLDDLIAINPDFEKDASFLVFNPSQKKIVRAILDEDINALRQLFGPEVQISVGEYSTKVKVTEAELKLIENKQSLVYKIIFADYKTLWSVIPDLKNIGMAWHSVKYCLENGFLEFTGESSLAFSLNAPRKHGIRINMTCAQEKCVIDGFSAAGYGAGLDK